jgi:5-methylcytosine-specific restriction endonuclease McrA
MSDFHKTAAWQRLRRQYKDHCRRTNALCYLCVLRGKDHELAQIDYGASRTGNSFELDHVQPVERFPEYALLWENFRPAHQRCNRQKHTKDAEQQGVWIRPDW